MEMEMEMEWVRGATVGRGSFSTVNLAVSKNCRQVMAVKSSPLSKSSLLQREKSILAHLQGCPQIVRCFGDSITEENGGVDTLYNVFLEYLPRGTLYDLLRRCGGSLAEAAVRCYTRSLLQGLQYIHAQGYVHCDVKLQNILVCSDQAVKIADFGLAKKAGQRVLDDGSAHCLRGTPLYMAPESVVRSVYEASADIWSVGCAVAEMVSGKPAWSCSDDRDGWALLLRIGFGDEIPEIPQELSDEGKAFLGKCFVRDPMKRWTAEMLLNHPFLASQDDDRVEDDAKDFMTPQALVDVKHMDGHLSPRSVFDLARSLTVGSSFTSITWASSMETSALDCPVPALVVDRMKCLETGPPPDWSCSTLDDGWITVRNSQRAPKSEETKDFMTSQLLLDAKHTEVYLSPRTIFNFTRSSSCESSFTSITSAPMDESALGCPSSLVDRMRCLAIGPLPDWSCSSLDDGWIAVRNYQPASKSDEAKEMNSESEHNLFLIIENMVSRDENRGENPCWHGDGQVSRATSEHVLPTHNWCKKEFISNSDLALEIAACPRNKEEEISSFWVGGGGNSANIGWLDASCFRFWRPQECIDISISKEYKYRYFCC